MDTLKDMLYSSVGGHLVQQVIDFINREAERDGSQSHFKDTARTKDISQGSASKSSTISK